MRYTKIIGGLTAAALTTGTICAVGAGPANAATRPVAQHVQSVQLQATVPTQSTRSPDSFWDAVAAAVAGGLAGLAGKAAGEYVTSFFVLDSSSSSSGTPGVIGTGTASTSDAQFNAAAN